MARLQFIDLCAGIGGGRLGLEMVGMECVGFAETSPTAVAVYREFYGDDERNFGDVMEIDPAELPAFDVLIAGFPCQPFSQMGKKKGLCDPRGQIIYGIAAILEAQQPKYFILENVKGLTTHDGGATVGRMVELLEGVGYTVVRQVLNSRDHGVPQSRERLYMVGVRADLGAVYEFPEPITTPPLLEVVEGGTTPLTEQRRASLQKYLDTRRLPSPSIEALAELQGSSVDVRQSDLRTYDGYIPTLRAGRQGIFIATGSELRELTGQGCLQLQGFPWATIKKTTASETTIKRLAGNAMTVPVLTAIAEGLYFGEEVDDDEKKC